MAVPHTIGRYEIVGSIGSGGMGTLLRARDPKIGGRTVAIKLLKEEAKAALTAELGADKFTDVDLNVVFEDLQYKAYRQNVLEKGIRADGRGQKDIRPLNAAVGVLPRVHGSASFQRGDTQNIALTTLGPTKEAQDMDGLTGGATSAAPAPTTPSSSATPASTTGSVTP